MWNQHCFVFLRYLIIFHSLGLIVFVIHIYRPLSFSSSPAINLFNHEKLLFLLGTERNFFDTAVQRLLSTHSSMYNDPTAICKIDGTLNSKDNQPLNYAARLLPKLMTQLVPYPHNYFKDRGIVLTTGHHQLLHTRFNLRIIEWSRTKLPVEVWYSSTQITKTAVIDLLNSVPTVNVKACCFEIAQCHLSNGTEIKLTASYIYTPRKKNVPGKVYAFKPAAILSSTFAEVLFLDSDCYVVRDPIYLFENDPMYKKFGVLLDSDIYISHQHPRLWSLLNTTCLRHEYSIDSGALLFNKKRVWNGIYLAKLMGDYPKVFYKYFISNGDKDTFRLAFRYLKISYYIVSIPCSTGYIANETFCGVTLCKTDSLGLNVYFDHVHHPKHLSNLTFLKKNFTHTRIALADPNSETSFITSYCRLYSRPCFQVGFYNRSSSASFDSHCRKSALIHTEKPLVQLPSGRSVLWNPNVETKLLLMKKSAITMPGFIDFYFQCQNETIFRNVKL